MPLLLDVILQQINNPAPTPEPSVSLVGTIIAVVAALGIQPYLGKIWAAAASGLDGVASIVNNLAKERGVRIAVAQNNLEQNEFLFGKVGELTDILTGLSKTMKDMGDANASLGLLLVEERKDYNKDREIWRSEITTMSETATQRDSQISTALTAASEYKTKYEMELGLRTAAESREKLANERAERLQLQVDQLLKLQSGTITPMTTEGVQGEGNPI